jgi:peptidoglycan hydrolase-like protein with peptidoglycan-binding domain
MRGRNLALSVVWWIPAATLATVAWSDRNCAAEAPAAEDVAVTPALVREIQFMLLRLGMDSGPIDGVVGRQTSRAFREFQQRSGLPTAELVNGGKVSAAVLARLRGDAARVILNAGKKPEAPSVGATPPPAVAVAPPPRAAPAPDRYAACPYRQEDFRIGETQYTPDEYLQEGFDGSTARAVSMLNERLNEARQIAGSIGGAALGEVQRQSRVLDYFNCRLKIEQASQK